MLPPHAYQRYPELAAGGYSRVDGKVAFYQRVQALIGECPERPVIVDFGAGRGAGAEDPVALRRRLVDLRGPDRRVIGLDVDPVVLGNPLVDDAAVIPGSGRLPLEDASVDLLVCDFVWEHIDDPETVVAEFHRVLKPGGWVCALTPNRWGYIAVAARMVPNRLHVAALRRLQPHKAERDTFPTAYRMNTRRAFERLFPSDRFHLVAYTHDPEPYLYAGSSLLFTTVVSGLRFLPPALRSLWMVFVQKRATPHPPAQE
jgi:SAM-dependent methyltransferase